MRAVIAIVVLGLGCHGSTTTEGSAIGTGDFRNGKKVGEWVYHHPNGSVSAKVSYVDGVVEGRSVFSTPDGRVMMTAHWASGVAHGTVTSESLGHHIVQQFAHGRRSGTWSIDGDWETRSYAGDGTLLYWNGRAVPPPPEIIQLPDGGWLARRMCNLATWDTGLASPCLDLFESFQRCTTQACREIALDGYVMADAPSAFWKLVL